MARVFITSRFYEEEAQRLRAAGHTVAIRDGSEPIPRDELLAGAADADALICLLSDRIDADVLAAAPRLRVVANAAVGYENVDVEAAETRAVVVTNTPDVLTEATADLTFALLLAAARNVTIADRGLRAGEFPAWGLQQPLLGFDVHGKTLGIVGMGRIGTAVARRGRFGFGMRILYHNRHRSPDEAALHAEWRSFEQLLAESDFVSVHVPLTDETRHLFDRVALERMKPSAVFVNVSRGAVVDEEALAEALAAQRIAAAGLDVFENEPRVHPSLLELSDRVVLTPHLGSATVATRRAMSRLCVENVLAVLAGDPPLTPVGRR